MSQPCSAPLLVLIDAELFASNPTAGALAALVAARGIARGAISNRPEIATRLEHDGAAHWFDFWIAGEAGAWPFMRALALVDIEPQRTLLVSVAADALVTAISLGIRTCDADIAELERQLQ